MPTSHKIIWSQKECSRLLRSKNRRTDALVKDLLCEKLGLVGYVRDIATLVEQLRSTDPDLLGSTN